MPNYTIKHILLTTAGWLLFISHLAAQPTPKVFPLHTFFQANYDSTIIYHSGNNGYISPNYLILAKQRDKVYFFTYRSPYREARGRYFPGGLVKKFSQQEQAFSQTPPDTNRYLLAGTASLAYLMHCWRSIAPTRLWQLRDDKYRPTPPSKCLVEDADENTFYFIDKRTIKVAYLYAPAFYEECEGRNPDRQLAIKAMAALRALEQ